MMMDGLEMILIKGKPETQQIVSINEDKKGVYWVRFTNGKSKEIGNDAIEADTIHKYQGREKDIIVMSTVADTYNDFVDNANLINVAVSRAMKEFVLKTNLLI